jgi:hypothetical protein
MLSVTLVHNAGLPIEKNLDWDIRGADAGSAVFRVHLSGKGWRTVETIRKRLPMELRFCFAANCKFVNPDGYTEQATEGRLTMIEVECLDECESIPGAEHGVFWRTPAPAKQVGIGVVHWKRKDGVKVPTPPHWEYTTRREVFSEKDVFAPDQAIPLKFDRTFSVKVPKQNLGATLDIEMLDGSQQIVKVADKMVANAPIELVGQPEEAGEVTIYTYRVKMPEKLALRAK